MIVDIQIHSKPQAILKHLLFGRYDFNTKKQRILKSVNNSNYNPINIA